MAQKLKALAVPEEDRSSIPRTHLLVQAPGTVTFRLEEGWADDSEGLKSTNCMYRSVKTTQHGQGQRCPDRMAYMGMEEVTAQLAQAVEKMKGDRRGREEDRTLETGWLWKKRKAARLRAGFGSQGGKEEITSAL